jgi:peptidoglycan hydrolase-like protein with peptidoglycan-binding domain
VDGIPGPRTRAAVRRYQRAVGQPVDGVVDAELLEAITDTRPAAIRSAAARPSGAARSGPAPALSEPIDELRDTLDRLFGLTGTTDRSLAARGPGGPGGTSRVMHR